jgi:hypothetical protein
MARKHLKNAGKPPTGMRHKRWPLLARRTCLVPTWRGWIVCFAFLVMLGMVLVRLAYPFLALNAPISAGGLVVEGWAPDYALEFAKAEFTRNHYDKIFVTGGPLESGAPLSEYHTYAELGVAILQKMGVNSNLVEAVPAPLVKQDRTFTAAVYLKKWWVAHGQVPAKVNLLTLGPHARRSRLLYEKAFGKSTEVGIIAIPPRNYDADEWWRSSAGVRTVLDEVFAYLYARLLFHPSTAAERP